LLLLVGCLALVVFAALAAGGYFGYRYWSTLPGSEEAENAGGQSADADWGPSALAAHDLAQAQARIDPQVNRLAESLKRGDLQQVESMTLAETREDLRSAFQGHPDRMERFARLLATRKLIVAEGALAEFEVTEEGRVFTVTFQRIGDNWALHSF